MAHERLSCLCSVLDPFRLLNNIRITKQYGSMEIFFECRIPPRLALLSIQQMACNLECLTILNLIMSPDRKVPQARSRLRLSQRIIKH